MQTADKGTLRIRHVNKQNKLKLKQTEYKHTQPHTHTHIRTSTGTHNNEAILPRYEHSSTAPLNNTRPTSIHPSSCHPSNHPPIIGTLPPFWATSVDGGRRPRVWTKVMAEKQTWRNYTLRNMISINTKTAKGVQSERKMPAHFLSHQFFRGLPSPWLPMPLTLRLTRRHRGHLFRPWSGNSGLRIYMLYGPHLYPIYKYVYIYMYIYIRYVC